MIETTRARGAPRHRLYAAVAASFFIEGVAFAGPEDADQCASAAEHAQQLRDEGKYRRAREQMLVCARDVCPRAVKSDCGKWLGEIDRDAPTVVLGARDGKGADLFDVKVSMDGTPIQERLDGKPVIVDSGEHTFRFEAKDGTVKEEKVLIRAAEKGRPILATLGAAAPVRDAPPEQKEQEAGSIAPIVVLGGVGALALGSFAYFGITGKNDVDDLQLCKPNCRQDDVDSARTKLIVADVSLGVGVVALGVAAYLLVTRPSGRATTGNLRLNAGALAGGGYAALGGRF
jgi:hypothetical protein